jgi:hypothetical protein
VWNRLERRVRPEEEMENSISGSILPKSDFLSHILSAIFGIGNDGKFFKFVENENEKRILVYLYTLSHKVSDEVKALIGINDVFCFMREKLYENEKKIFVKKSFDIVEWGALHLGKFAAYGQVELHYTPGPFQNGVSMEGLLIFRLIEKGMEYR